MAKPFKHILVATYAHPELYPPILSAVDQLSRETDSIDIVTRKMLESKWEYPLNVKLNYVNQGNFKGFEIEQITLWKKITHFIAFIKTIKRLAICKKTDILMVHDVIPLYAAFLLKATLKKRGIKLWYHNHDVTDKQKTGKYSLMGLAARFEHKAFRYINLFTLPAKERLVYFPINKLKLLPLIVPNYPLQSFYKARALRPLKTDLKLVFQGSIGPGHGLEALIPLLSTPINDRKVELHLVGKVRTPYLDTLKSLANQYGVASQFFYHGMQSFATLPEFLSQFDVGIAIHQPYNVTYATGGSASNKIYEYAACGFPVILFDNHHYKAYLGQFEWTFFTDLTKESLSDVLADISNSYNNYATAARIDFETRFNFETMFQKTVIPEVKKLLNT